MVKQFGTKLILPHFKEIPRWEPDTVKVIAADREFWAIQVDHDIEEIPSLDDLPIEGSGSQQQETT